MTSGPPASNDCPSMASRPRHRRDRRRCLRARSAASRVETQRGQIIPGRRSTSATIVSNAALPAADHHRRAQGRHRHRAGGENARPSRRGCGGGARAPATRRRDHRGRRAVASLLARPPGQRSRLRRGRAARSRCCPGNGRGSRRDRRPSNTLRSDGASVASAIAQLRRRRSARAVDAKAPRRRAALQAAARGARPTVPVAPRRRSSRNGVPRETREVAPTERDVQPRLDLRVEQPVPAAP